jgi:ribosome-binding factor A
MIMIPYKRAHRVASDILHEIAGMVRNELDDPRLEGVSITRVELSDDLRHARVFFSMIAGEEEKESARRGLEHASGRIKKGITRLGLRFVPELLFIHDPGLEHSQRIENLLRQIHDSEQEDS